MLCHATAELGNLHSHTISGLYFVEEPEATHEGMRRVSMATKFDAGRFKTEWRRDYTKSAGLQACSSEGITLRVQG